MSDPVRIVGGYVSPYVRKVLVCLDLKGISYEIDPIVPFMGDDRFSQISPVRRIPVLIDDRVTLTDSSVICQYLEDRYPSPPLYPADIFDRAKARWLEEFADTRIGEVVIWRLFNQLVIAPFVWGKETDRAVVDQVLSEDLPHILDYLEAQVPAQGFLYGPISIADISICCFFRNAAFAGYTVDPSRWPLTAAYVERALAVDSFAKLRPFEECSMRKPIPLHREALAKIGAPVMRETYGGNSAPRRGIMQT